MTILIVRIAGRCKIQRTHEETLKRLRLLRKYSARFVDEKDKIRMGMVESVKDLVMYGKVDAKLEKQIKEKMAKDTKESIGLHPPVGGFKKSTKTRYPQGIKGHNKELSKYVERML